MPGRQVTHRYDDPLELIWLRAAEKLGLKIERSDEVYASYDGKGTLQLSSESDFDPDDSLAQLIFHEFCHALVRGPDALKKADWGLDNYTDDDVTLEHACHRTQAALAQRYGLRAFFAVTTDHRTYWDSLPDRPLAPGDDPAIALARAAIERADAEPWRGILNEALMATARLGDLVRAKAPAGSLWTTTRDAHPGGFRLHPNPALACRECGWAFESDAGMGCRQLVSVGRTQRNVRDDPACERWEPHLDDSACGPCGACCREGFHLVPLGEREPLASSRPDLVTRDTHGLHLARPGGHCVALEGDGVSRPFRCTVYSERPEACREFAVAGDACLIARRRVGLSR
jgi:hypothetical protein